MIVDFNGFNDIIQYMKRIIEELKKCQDKNYAEFQAKLIPTLDKKTIIGVRTTDLKKLSKDMANVINENIIKPNIKYKNKNYTNVKLNRRLKKQSLKTNIWSLRDVEKFLIELPHKYFDEMQLHSFIISNIKDFDICIKYVEKFLPYIDNWATCDQLSPKVFAKNKAKLIEYIKKWIKSNKTYTIRFGIVMLMRYFLDEDFNKNYFEMVISAGENVNCNSRISKLCFKSDAVSSCRANEIEKIDININPDKYYIEMAKAWFFATALYKQYDDTLPIIKNYKLLNWTHNKTIQKAKESFRVKDKHKKILNNYINSI